VSEHRVRALNVACELVPGLTYGQNVLENTLRSHWEQFNPSIILTKCAHHQNWVAAAVVRLRARGTL
jgi:hypothetical protein